MPDSATLSDVVCLGCACLCDDIGLRIAKNRVVEVHNACPTGQQWFQQPLIPAQQACQIDGKRATVDQAVAAAAQLLDQAKHPAITGLASVSVDAQRRAIAIADQVGGVILATGSGVSHAVRTHGAATATLGEVARRADVVLFWQCDPATTHPRHFERYSLFPTSSWLPRGRADRTVFAIGDPQTPTADAADHVISLPHDGDHDTVAALRTSTDASWQTLAEAARQANYVALFYGEDLDHPTVGDLMQWMIDLQQTTRAAALCLGGSGENVNAAGAENVVAWQTAHVGVVDFAPGYPAAATTLGDQDLTLALSTTTITLVDNAACTDAIVLQVAPPGFTARSAAYRSDGVALPLRQPWAIDALSTEWVLAGIWQHLQRRQHKGSHFPAESP